MNIPAKVKQLLDQGSDLAVNLSGGKDSQAMLIVLRELGISGKLIGCHQDVGRWEWRQSQPFCQQLCDEAGISLVIQSRDEDLHARVIRRMQERPEVPPFPSSAARYCTAGWKRDVFDKWVRANYDSMLVSALGLRAQESKGRAKKPSCSDRRSHTKNRMVVDWHPILDMDLAEVWRLIGYSLDELAELQAHGRNQVFELGRDLDEVWRETGFKAHPAYLVGNERVSCAMCVLASRNDIENGVRLNPELAHSVAKIEQESGFTFKQGMAIGDVLTNFVL